MPSQVIPAGVSTIEHGSDLPMIATASAHHRKRSALARLDENAPSKRRKQMNNPPISTQTPSQLTETNLVTFAKNNNAVATSFDKDAKSRAIQEAGTQMDFNLRLECYDQATTTSINDWIHSLDTLFGDRPIFKDKADLAAMSSIAMTFEVALVEC
jgi:hypothetical protein